MIRKILGIGLILLAVLAQTAWAEPYEPTIKYDEKSGVITAEVMNPYDEDMKLTGTALYLKNYQAEGNAWGEFDVIVKPEGRKTIEFKPKKAGTVQLSFQFYWPKSDMADSRSYETTIGSVPKAPGFDAVLAIAAVIGIATIARRRS